MSLERMRLLNAFFGRLRFHGLEEEVRGRQEQDCEIQRIEAIQTVLMSV